HNTSQINAESILNQTDADKITNHMQDFNIFTSAPNKIYRAKGLTLLLQKINTQSSVQKLTNYINIGSDSDQDDTDKMTDYAQDSDNYTSNKDYDFESTGQDNINETVYNSDTLTPAVNTLPLLKKQNINLNTLTSAISPLKKNLQPSVQKHNGIKTTSKQDNAIKNNVQDSSTSNNTDKITKNH
ncbi:10482_t:CDS:2, partial [Cetraspora pellucida]